MDTTTEPVAAAGRDRDNDGAAPFIMYGTAFIEGMTVIVVEIAGARALAPFFGTSLQVWTALITVTLFFLAVGYGLGGLLAKRLRRGTLPTLFAVAGVWLCTYPLVRTPILNFIAGPAPVALGGLVSASVLFGVPLLMLGSVAPVLIQYLATRRPGAGAAAGRLFFTNTMGGLAGGWRTAFLLIPYSSLRLSLVACGVVLLILALLWSFVAPRAVRTVVAVRLLIGISVLVFRNPSRSSVNTLGMRFNVLSSQQSGIGLLRVFE